MRAFAFRPSGLSSSSFHVRAHLILRFRSGGGRIPLRSPIDNLLGDLLVHFFALGVLEPLALFRCEFALPNFRSALFELCGCVSEEISASSASSELSLKEVQLYLDSCASFLGPETHMRIGVARLIAFAWWATFS